MKTVGIWFSICMITFTVAWAQAVNSDTLKQPAWQINLSSPSSQLLVDEEGNVLVLASEQAQLFKYLEHTDFDSSIVIGGQSNRQEGFLHPIQIAQKNRLNLYLLDDVQRRIVLLNTNFKLVQEVDFRGLASRLESLGEESEIFPQSFDINPAGEIYLLNQFNNKVIKLNTFGDIETVFGGLDYGEGSLYEPVSVALDRQNYLFVADTSAQEIKVFDAYGVYRYTFRPKSSFRWQQFRLYESSVICFDSQRIHVEQLTGSQVKEYIIPAPYTIHDCVVSPSFFYVLLENGVSLQGNSTPNHSVHVYRLSP